MSSEHSAENLLGFLAWDEDEVTLRGEKFNDDLIKLLAVYSHEVIAAAALSEKLTEQQLAVVIARVKEQQEDSRTKEPNYELVHAMLPLFMAYIQKLGQEKGTQVITDSVEAALKKAQSSTGS